MADNVDITAGTGTTIAADDISGVLHQRVKLSLGADGVAADAPGEGTYGLDVDITSLYMTFNSKGTFATLGTTEKYILGDSTWSAESLLTNTNRFYLITNCDDTKPMYVARLATGGTLAGSVTTVNYMCQIPPGVSVPVFCPAGWNLVAVRASAGLIAYAECWTKGS